ncbi:ABC transporter permease [bacterium]|nr:ABC transporter permease [bacterium]MBU1919653.1 ABC transporter permease [bacterium]
MFRNYLRIAFAVFMRRKFFTLISLFGITFTLAILVATIGVMDNTFGELPPEVNQDRTLNVFSLYSSRETEQGTQVMHTRGISQVFLERMTKELPGIERVSLYSNRDPVTSYHGGEQLESQLKYVDLEFWRILRFEFLEGRPFTEDEYKNAAFTAIINETTRRKFFGTSPAAGKTLELGGNSYRVVGVVHDIPLIRNISYSDIWLPRTLKPDIPEEDRIFGSYMALILAENSGNFHQIREEFRSRVEEYKQSDKSYTILVCYPETLFEQAARDMLTDGSTYTDASLPAIGAIIILGILFMVLPTINLVNLNIGRIAERASEIGVRRAFGAPTGSLILQFLVENVILCLIGGIIAIPSAYLILEAISSLGLIPFSEFTINYRVFAYALAVTLFFGIFSGVYPAWRMSRMHPVDALRGGGA